MLPLNIAGRALREVLGMGRRFSSSGMYEGHMLLVEGGVARLWACRGGGARATRTRALFAARDFYSTRHWLLPTQLFSNETGIEIS